MPFWLNLSETDTFGVTMIIKNSVVLITSAGTSLGAMIALHFAKLGARIVLCDVNPSSLLATYRRCSNLPSLSTVVEIEDIS